MAFETTTWSLNVGEVFAGPVSPLPGLDTVVQ